jgi:hypothetical protein
MQTFGAGAPGLQKKETDRQVDPPIARNQFRPASLAPVSTEH